MDPLRDDSATELVDPIDRALSQQFVNFAATSARRAPLYSALARGIAEEPSLFRLLVHAPAEQQQPVLLFACTHHLVLDEPGSDLAQWYPNLTSSPRPADDPDLLPAFRDFVEARVTELTWLLSTRTTQTNEVGRCGLFLPVFGMLADEVGLLGHIDVGTSGGLNLLLDRYQYRYRSDDDGPASVSGTTTVGGPSTVVLDVSTRGVVPVPRTMPTIGARVGIDREPVDVTDPIESRWLEACVWPDQADRFHRLRAAIELATTARPAVRSGDAIAALRTAVAEVATRCHPVVTNSWVLNYLTPAQRVAYLHELEGLGAQRDLSWVFAESPELVPELPIDDDLVGADVTAMTLVRWRDGVRTSETLAVCHPHGYWIHWR